MYRPWMNRHFGIELEMNDIAVDNTALEYSALRGAVVTGVEAVGLRAGRVSRAQGGYYHSSGDTWDVKTDGSCGHAGRVGWEVASPKMMLDADAECPELREVCAALNELNPRIDRKCGLHVHVEVTDFSWRDLRNLLILWARYEPFFFELCPPNRAVNSYCPPFHKARWADTPSGYWSRLEPGLTADEDAFRRIMTSTPRGSLNLGHFWRSQRIEFRLAGGSVNYEKIVRWVQLLLSLVHAVKTLSIRSLPTGNWSTRGFSTRYVFKMLGLAPSAWRGAEEIPPASDRLLRWAEARRAQFQRTRHRSAAPTAPAAPVRTAGDPIRF